MTALSVGERYPGASAPMPEGVLYSYDTGGHLVLVALGSPTPSEVLALRRGEIDIAAWDDGTAVVLAVRASGAIGWSACVYDPARVPEDRRAMPPPIADGEGAAMAVVLVDAATAVVRSLRLVGLDTRFSRDLHTAITRAQSATGSTERITQWAAMADSDTVRARVSRSAVARTTIPSRAQD